MLKTLGFQTFRSGALGAEPRGKFRIIPKQVRELMDEGNEVRSCFLGYTELTREEKFTHIRTHHQDNRDWTREIADNELYGYVDEMLEFSHYLKSECTTHIIPYFDISKDFETPRTEAFNYLFA